MHERDCKQYIFTSYNICFQRYEICWRSFHILVRKRQKGSRFLNFHFYGPFSIDFMAVKGLMPPNRNKSKWHTYCGVISRVRMIRQFVVSEVQPSCQTKRKKINEYICELGLNTSPVTLSGVLTLKPRTKNGRQTTKRKSLLYKSVLLGLLSSENKAHISHQ